MPPQLARLPPFRTKKKKTHENCAKLEASASSPKHTSWQLLFDCHTCKFCLLAYPLLRSSVCSCNLREMRITSCLRCQCPQTRSPRKLILFETAGAGSFQAGGDFLRRHRRFRGSFEPSAPRGGCPCSCGDSRIHCAKTGG